MSKHIASKHCGKQTFTCQECGAKFVGRKSFGGHLSQCRRLKRPRLEAVSSPPPARAEEVEVDEKDPLSHLMDEPISDMEADTIPFR
jgi:hypothetical protein